MKKSLTSIKNIFLTIVFNFLCILMWFVNGVQALYYFIVGIIQIPQQLLKSIAIFMCLCGGFELYVAGNENTGNLIFNLLALVLIMCITYKIIEFALNLVLLFVITILNLLNAGNLLVGLASLVDRLQDKINYQAPCANGNATYLSARILLKLDWLLQKVFRVIAYAMYPVCIGGGLFAVWYCVREEFFTGVAWGTIECVYAGVILTCVVVILSIVANSLCKAIIDACDVASLLDDLFGAYSGMHYRCQNKSEQRNYEENRTNFYEQTQEVSVDKKEDNQYDIIFEKIEDDAELKKQFRKMVKELHPDVNTKLSYEQANYEMAQLNVAYERARTRITSRV